jgi:hypothetical protein
MAQPMSDATNEPLGKVDEIRLSRKTVRVPREKRQELAQRLEAAGFTHAADNLRHRRAFSGPDKPQVFGVLNDWFDEVRKDAFGPELISLRHELDADISQKKH